MADSDPAEATVAAVTSDDPEAVVVHVATSHTALVHFSDWGRF